MMRSRGSERPAGFKVYRLPQLFNLEGGSIMNAIEIRGLKKSFRGLYALDGLNMTVPVGAIYGFIGENGSGKSTTEKLICGHLVPSGGKIKLFGKSYKDAGVRARVGALVENTGCFPNSSICQNLMMQCINLIFRILMNGVRR